VCVCGWYTGTLGTVYIVIIIIIFLAVLERARYPDRKWKKSWVGILI